MGAKVPQPLPSRTGLLSGRRPITAADARKIAEAALADRAFSEVRNLVTTARRKIENEAREGHRSLCHPFAAYPYEASEDHVLAAIDVLRADGFQVEWKPAVDTGHGVLPAHYLVSW